jgi:uncharacterized protein (DUF983 family)
MSLRARLTIVGLAVIVFSVYIGLEIDYRHWSWLIFLVVLPVGLMALIVSLNMKQARPESAGSKLAKKPNKRRR